MKIDPNLNRNANKKEETFSERQGNNRVGAAKYEEENKQQKNKMKRWGQKAETLPADHPAWDLEATYLAHGLASLICTLSPQRIIMGGGVMQQPHLFPLVRAKTQALLNGYVQAPQILSDIEAYIVPPGLGSQSGMLGALVLAEQALK